MRPQHHEAGHDRGHRLTAETDGGRGDQVTAGGGQAGGGEHRTGREHPHDIPPARPQEVVGKQQRHGKTGHGQCQDPQCRGARGQVRAEHR